LYFSVGIPAVCLISMAVGFFEPKHSLVRPVAPRFTGDGFGLRFSESYNHRWPREAPEQAATKIRASLEM
jgi:hypothetical protein